MSNLKATDPDSLKDTIVILEKFQNPNFANKDIMTILLEF